MAATRVGGSTMKENFYKEFEDRFRGSRESIKERLRVYLPLIEPLKQLYPDTSVVDLGCGRGEWLELLDENGFVPLGVDQDAQMLRSAEELNLNVIQGDAIEYLKHLPDDSVALVSGFHIAEHLPFEILSDLIFHALRVLKPAGLLILETPNPENIAVGSHTFYIDPTHLRPIPPAFLSFLPQQAGFMRTTVFRMNGKTYGSDAYISLFDVITGASPDYAVIAQKSGDTENIALFDSEFRKHHGTSMEELALRNAYQMEYAESRIAHLFDKIDDKERMIHELSSRLNMVHSHLDAVNARFEEEIHNIYNSRSWKITRPLRLIAEIARRLKSYLRAIPAKIKQRLRGSIGYLLRRLIGVARSNPIAHAVAIRIAHRFPALTIRIKKRLYDTAVPLPLNTDQTLLSPRSARIYHDLKRSIDDASRGGH